MLRPVEGQGAVALHVKVAGLTLGDGMAGLVQDLELVARDWFTGGTRPQVVQAIGAVDVQHLGRADAVEDGEAVGILPAPPDLGGKRLGGGDAVPDRGEVAALCAFEVEDGVVEGWGREEQGRAPHLACLQYRWGGGWP